MRELKIKNISWISMIRPTEDDIKELRERFPQIHPLILEELSTATIRSRVENYDHHLYMVLHFPKFIQGMEKSLSYEIDVILMPETIITVQYDTIPILEEFWHECEAENKTSDMYGKTPIHLLYYLLRQFFINALRELDQIQGEIDGLEEKVFSGQEKEILEDIAFLKRDILDFRRAFKPQRLTLESFTSQGSQLYGDSVKPFLKDLEGEYLKVWDFLETHKETIDALYETNNSLLTTKTNNIALAFTILAFITFIPTAIANIYGMNIHSLPLAEKGNSFWIILGIMVITTMLVYLLLKWRKLV